MSVFVLRRKLRAAYVAAQDELRVCTSELRRDPNVQIWTAFELARFNLERARRDYFETVIEASS